MTDQPPFDLFDQETATAPPRRYARGTGIAALGTVLLIASAVGYWQPRTVFEASVSQAHGLCSSAAGEVGQAISAVVQTDCGQVGQAVAGIVLLALAGAALLGFGLLRMHRDEGES